MTSRSKLSNFPKHPRQIQIALTREHVLNQTVCRDEQHRSSRLHELVPYGAHRVCLARTGQAEGEHVYVTLHGGEDSRLCK